MIKRGFAVVLALVFLGNLIFLSGIVSALNYCAVDNSCYIEFGTQVCTGTVGQDSGGEIVCQGSILDRSAPEKTCTSSPECLPVCTEAQCGTNYWTVCGSGGYQYCTNPSCNPSLNRACTPPETLPSGTYTVGSLVTLSATAYAPQGGASLSIILTKDGVNIELPSSCTITNVPGPLSVSCNYFPSQTGNYQVTTNCVETSPSESYYGCSLGLDSSTFTVIAAPPTCTANTPTYGTCINGQQTKTTTYTPEGCSTTTVETISCSGSNGDSCNDYTQCSSLYCTGNTVGSVCAPAPECSSFWWGNDCDAGYECSGTWSGTCVPIVVPACNVNTESYGVCINGFKTNTTTFTPNGCSTPTPSSVACLGSTGDACTSGTQCNSGICNSQKCSPSNSPKIYGSVWKNMIGTTISSADKEDTMMMVATGDKLDGKAITFTICEDKVIDDCTSISPKTVESTSETSVSTTVKISKQGTYYFTAAVSGSNQKSGNLVVSDSIYNNPPTSIISSPTEDSLHFVNSPVNFVSASTDVDDEITGQTWNFGDTFTSTLKTTTHPYSSIGQKTITLEVIDGRGATALQSRGISVVSLTGYTLVAKIDEPLENQVLVSDNDDLIVEYSASSSYVINKTVTMNGAICTMVVDCIQGNCPASIAAPDCAASSNPIIVNNGVQGYNKINFEWTFEEDDGFLSPVSGNGVVSGIKRFNEVGEKTIKLKAKFSAPNANTEQFTVVRDFSIYDQKQCNSAGNVWYEITNGFISSSSSTLNTISCAGENGDAGDADDCCPQGYVCSTSGSPGCYAEESGLDCASYTNQLACEADLGQRAKNEILYYAYPEAPCGKSVNGVYIECECYWSIGKDKCMFSRMTGNEDISGATTMCNYETKTGECINGVMSVEITAIGDSVSDPLCINSNPTLACGRPVVALPFVGVWQIITILVVIILAYYFLNKINRKPINKVKLKRR